MPPHDQDRASPTAYVAAEAPRDAVAAPNSSVERSRSEFVETNIVSAVSPRSKPYSEAQGDVSVEWAKPYSEVKSEVSVEQLAVAIADINEKFSRMAAGAMDAETSLLKDFDLILSRLDSGIERERQAMDLLLNRIHSPAS
jgi:hypothetical protein